MPCRKSAFVKALSPVMAAVFIFCFFTGCFSAPNSATSLPPASGSQVVSSIPSDTMPAPVESVFIPPDLSNYVIPTQEIETAYIQGAEEADFSGLSVSLSFYDEDSVFLVDYYDLFIMNLSTGSVSHIASLPEVDVWMPTGVFYDPVMGYLYIANYGGHDVLQVTFDPISNQIQLVNRFTHSQMVSPENVSVTPDGKYVAVADYDGNMAFLFDQSGNIVWSYVVPFAHGITIVGDYVYATSLGDKAIYKLELSTGALVLKNGSVGWGENNYIWPTDILEHNGQLLVVDAHQGTITTINTDLVQVARNGANALASTCFNLPYGLAICGNSLFMADTYNYRIVEMPLDGDEFLVGKEYVVRPRAEQDIPGVSTLCGSVPYQYALTSHPVNFPADWFLPQSPDPTQSSYYVASYKRIVEVFEDSNVFKYPIHPNFSFEMYYTFSLVEGDYLFLFSAERPYIVVYNNAEKLFCHLEIDPSWLVGDEIYTIYYEKVDTQELIDKAQEEFAVFHEAMAAGSSWDEALFSNVSTLFSGKFSTKEDMLQSFITTAEGRKLINAVINNPSIFSSEFSIYQEQAFAHGYAYINELMIFQLFSKYA